MNHAIVAIGENRRRSLKYCYLSSYPHIFRVSEVRSAAMSGANSLGHRSQTSPEAV